MSSLIEPNIFKQSAQSGKASLIPDPASTFWTNLLAILGPVATTAVSPAVGIGAPLVHYAIEIPDAATTTYTYLTGETIEIVDVICRKNVAGAGNTIQVKDSLGNAISDAMATAVDKTITRAGTLDIAFNPIAGSALGFQITATRAAGSMLCQVTVVARRRA